MATCENEIFVNLLAPYDTSTGRCQRVFEICGKSAKIRYSAPYSKEPMNLCADCADPNVLAMYQWAQSNQPSESWDKVTHDAIDALAPKEPEK